MGQGRHTLRLISDPMEKTVLGVPPPDPSLWVEPCWTEHWFLIEIA